MNTINTRMTYQVFHYDSQEAFSCFSHSERYRFQFFVTCKEEHDRYWYRARRFSLTGRFLISYSRSYDT